MAVNVLLKELPPSSTKLTSEKICLFELLSWRKYDISACGSIFTVGVPGTWSLGYAFLHIKTFFIAPCKVIQIPESVKCLLMESGSAESVILGVGVQNSVQRIRNPSSTDKECPQRVIQDCLRLLDQFRFLGTCPPTPSLSQHYQLYLT